MPLQTGFVFSFFAACKPEYGKDSIEKYPYRADGYFSANPSTLPLLLKTNAVQNLSPSYFEITKACFGMLENCSPYHEEILRCSHLVFTYKDTPILVFENVSIANSDYIMKIDFSYLIPHWISSEQLETRNLSEKRWVTFSLLGAFLAYGLLN